MLPVIDCQLLKWKKLYASNPSVAECAVFGIEDQLKGQIPLALVVLKSGDYVSSFELEYNIVTRS